MKSASRVCTALVAALAFTTAASSHPRPASRKRAHHTVSAVKSTPPTEDRASAATPAIVDTPLQKTSEQTPGKASERARESSIEVNPHWFPMAATSGGLGLFTIDTGETLPQHGVSFEVGANKLSRDPGSVTVLQLGWSIGYGITDKLTALVQFNVHNHVHVDNPAELSLDNGTGAQFGNTIYNAIVPGGLPAYVEDYPFAFANNGGIGNIDVGLKYGFLSERRGNPVSLALRGDVFIPTKTSLNSLLTNQSQSGALDFQMGANLSKSVLDDTLVVTADVGYRATRDPTHVFNNSPALTRADQIHAGAGFLAFPRKRFQLMSEYTATIYTGNHTPDTTFDARDPIDGVWGFRLYLARFFALDAGYRYSLNLHNVRDRNGFVVKLGADYWPEKPVPLPEVDVQLMVDPASVMEGTGEQVKASAKATDSAGWPLTYMWTTNAGSIIGTGPNVRWDSTGVKAGAYTINAIADDGRGGTGAASAQITVQSKPVPPPSMTCSVDRSSVMAGEKVSVTANVNDQSGTPLAYQWQTSGGQILGSGASIQVDTTGLAPGGYAITGQVRNGKAVAANCSASVTIQTPPPPPQASKISQCYFRSRSARVDNVCKRVLDDVAVRLQNDPKAKVVVIGYATPRKGRARRLADRLAKARAENAKAFLSEKKGVDASRIETRIGKGAARAGKENRRMDIVWVPEGATY